MAQQPNGCDVAAALTLADVPGVGAVGYARLVRRFGSAANVLGAGIRRLCEEGEAREELARVIAAASPGEEVHRQLAWARRSGGRILPLEDTGYPTLLKELSDPPPVLYVQGEGLAVCQRPIAVVGSRGLSAYGRHMTRLFCRTFAEAGMTVVSGMALGVDGEAHRATLGAGGNTVAVLGSGLDRPYPTEHGALFGELVKRGAVLSEFAPGTAPLAVHFPRRNRVISGLSWGVLVVEAQKGSGSLITARYAADQGRGVFALPGNVDQPGAAGTNALIREGATLVTHPDQVVTELLPHLIRDAPSRIDPPPSGAEGLSDLNRRILGELSSVPVLVDTLAERFEVPVSSLLVGLMEMELRGMVEKLAGNRYIRPPRLTAGETAGPGRGASDT